MSVDLVGFVNLVGAYQDPWGDYTRLQYITGFLAIFWLKRLVDLLEIKVI